MCIMYKDYINSIIVQLLYGVKLYIQHQKHFQIIIISPVCGKQGNMTEYHCNNDKQQNNAMNIYTEQ